jgi:hypothetical protein
MLLDSLIMVHELSIMLLENIYGTVIAPDDWQMLIVICSNHDYKKIIRCFRCPVKFLGRIFSRVRPFCERAVSDLDP